MHLSLTLQSYRSLKPADASTSSPGHASVQHLSPKVSAMRRDSRPVLVTGGAGYIGSTVASALIDANIEPVILDNLTSGTVRNLANRLHVVGDIADPRAVREAFRLRPDIAAVVHCAALTSVPESRLRPLDYYRVNVSGTVALLASMKEHGCRRLVFSSSAAVYGDQNVGVLDEATAVAPSSAYARTKVFGEKVIAAAANTGDIRAVNLRYFNPVGVDPQGRTGPATSDPARVVDRMVAAGHSGAEFTITGDDFATRDGTGVRDYVHVWDVALAHVAALQAMADATRLASCEVINLGTGIGTSVLELVSQFEKATGMELRTVTSTRRPGDVAMAVASNRRAIELLGWRARLSVVQAIREALEWQVSQDRVAAG